MARRPAIAVLVSLLSSATLLGMPQQQAGTTSTGASVGTKIGEGISAAITAAFPGVSKIIDLIWPKRADGSANTDSKKKTDATAVAQNVTKDPNVKKGIADLDAISKQLDTVSTFISHCVVAENDVVAIEELLQGKTWPLTAGDKLRLDNYWTEASARIAKLSPSAQSLSALGNPAMQAVFQAVADANIGKLAQIENAIKSTDPSARGILQNQLATLDGQLSAVNALSGEIIVNISAGLKDTKNTAAGAQGSGRTDAYRAAIKDFDTVLTKRYGALSR